MSAATVTPPPASRAGPVTQPHTPGYASDASIYRFSPEQYDRMVESGILGLADKVELLEGFVVNNMPPNPPHSGTVNLVAKRVRRHLPVGWDDRTQPPVRLPDSRPEPDVAVVRERDDNYTAQHPGVPDIGLLIEVADSSLDRDLIGKAGIYARAGVPVYWVIVIPGLCVEVHTDPTGTGDTAQYATVTRYAAGESVPLVLDGVTVASIPAADLLP